MNRLHSIVRRIPNRLPTVLAVGLLLWLTLASKPLGDNDMPLFQGADKLAHALMFGGTTAVLLFDIQRERGWHALRWILPVTAGTVFSLVGVAIEFAQEVMGNGRSFERADIAADTVGAYTMAILWIIFQKYWSIKTSYDGRN